MEISTEFIRIFFDALDHQDVRASAIDVVSVLEEVHDRGVRWTIEPSPAAMPAIESPAPGVMDGCSLSAKAWESLRHELFKVTPDYVYMVSGWKMDRLKKHFEATPTRDDSWLLIQATETQQARHIYDAIRNGTINIDAACFTWAGVGPIFYCADNIPF